MNSELASLLVALGQAALPVIYERYPQVPQMAGELILVASVLSRFVAAAKGNGKVGSFMGYIGKAVDYAGFNKPKIG